MRNIRNIIFILLTTVLFGCKQQTVKQEIGNDTIAWAQLQQQTLLNLQEKNYGDASAKIIDMMASAGEDSTRWEYIRMALATMPADLSLPLVDKAVESKFVKNKPNELYGFSRVLTQFQKNEQAIKLINKAIVQDKKEAYVYWRARLYLMVDNTELAEQDYKWLIKQDSGNVEYLGQYATLLSYSKRDEEALELLSKHETDAKLLFQQIVLLFQQGNDDEVAKKFEQLKQIIANQELESSQYLDIGELAYWLEDYDTSLSVLEKVKNSDDLSEAKLMMGRALMEKGNFDRATVLFKQVQNGPVEQAIPAYLHEIELLRQQQHFDEAITVASQALMMFSNDADLLYARAMLYEQVDDIVALEKDLRAIIDDNPKNADALNALGYTWADRDMNLGEAYEYIMQAYELKPENKAILDSVGWIYYKKGNLQLAEKYLRMAIQDNVQDRESYDHLLVVLDAQGKVKEAKVIKEQIKKTFDVEKK